MFMVNIIQKKILTFSIGQDKILRSEQYRHNITGYNTSSYMSFFGRVRTFHQPDRNNLL